MLWAQLRQVEVEDPTFVHLKGVEAAATAAAEPQTGQRMICLSPPAAAQCIEMVSSCRQPALLCIVRECLCLSPW